MTHQDQANGNIQSFSRESGMTHRPISSIAINGFDPGGVPRALPIFEWVDPKSLLIDPSYQRDSSERSLKLVRKIVSNWDWARYKPPVAVLTDGGLELVDGQHTAIAAATHPDIEQIPVMIVEAPERAERAAAFIGHNRDRIAVTTPQLHVAALAAGDEGAKAIQRVCDEAGVRVLRTQPGSGRYKPAETVSVTAIAALIRGRGEETAVRVMSCLARSGVAPITQLHVKAADLLLNVEEYSTQITADSLVASIQSLAPKIDSEVALFRAAHPSTAAWKAMAILWFKNRRAGKAANLPSKRSSAARTLLNQTEKISTLSGAAQTHVKSIVYQDSDNSVSSAGYVLPEKPCPIVDGVRTAPPTIDEDRPRALLPPERKGESIISAAKRDDRRELGGWQPGNHLRRCGPCGSPFVGGRKADSCADCAYRAEEVANA